jgi:hypothetical protein
MNYDAYKADGDGFLDILFSWDQPGFDASDTFIFNASVSDHNTSITADLFNATSNSGGNGTWTVAANLLRVLVQMKRAGGWLEILAQHLFRNLPQCFSLVQV